MKTSDAWLRILDHFLLPISIQLKVITYQEWILDQRGIEYVLRHLWGVGKHRFRLTSSWPLFPFPLEDERLNTSTIPHTPKGGGCVRLRLKRFICAAFRSSNADVSFWRWEIFRPAIQKQRLSPFAELGTRNQECGHHKISQRSRPECVLGGGYEP